MVHLIFIIAIVFSLPLKDGKKIDVPLFYLSFLILLVFLSLRYNYGNDYDAYEGIYINIKDGLNAWGSSDVGFKFLNQVSPSFQFFIIIHSILYIYSVFVLFNTFLNQNNLIFGMIIWLLNPYFFLIHLSSIRQTMSMSVFILSVVFLINGKRITSVFMAFLSMIFHKSSLLVLPFVFILNKKKNKKLWVDSLLIVTIILLITPLFNVVIDFMLPYFPSHYESAYLSENLGNSLISVIMSFVIYFIILINYKKLEGNEIILGKLSLIGASISVLTYKIAMLSRFQSYFDVFFIVLFPLIIEKQNTKFKKILIITLVIGIYALRYYSFFTNPLWIEGYSKYRTIFSY